MYFFRYTEEIQKLFNYSSTLEPRVWRVYDYPRRAEVFAKCKIYYCRLVRLGLGETFHNKPVENLINYNL